MDGALEEQTSHQRERERAKKRRKIWTSRNKDLEQQPKANRGPGRENRPGLGAFAASATRTAKKETLPMHGTVAD